MHVDLETLVTIAAVTRPPIIIDLTAVFVSGLSGAIFAVQRRFAVTGVLAIAIAAGLGGGILRDLLLNIPPVALTNPRYLPTVLVAALIGFYFASIFHRWQLMLDVLDPLWMGLFAVIGAQKALNADLGSWAAILVGCVTAFGGAVVRDLLAGETPQLVLPGPVNYLAAIVGSVFYVVMVAGFGAPKGVVQWLAVAVVFILRMIALRFGVKAPEPVDVPKQLLKGAERAGLPVRGRARRGARRAAPSEPEVRDGREAEGRDGEPD